MDGLEAGSEAGGETVVVVATDMMVGSRGMGAVVLIGTGTLWLIVKLGTAGVTRTRVVDGHSIGFCH